LRTRPRFGKVYDPAWENEKRSFDTYAYMLPGGEFLYRIIEPIERLGRGVPQGATDRTLYVLGRLEYKDAFKKDRWLTFRFTVGGDIAAGKGTLAPCEEGNDAN
jgi:hypothetical protein